MIERAEKQRLKREEKKKLAVLNKTTSGKPAAGVNSRNKNKKMPLFGLAGTGPGGKRTQVAI